MREFIRKAHGCSVRVEDGLYQAGEQAEDLKCEVRFVMRMEHEATKELVAVNIELSIWSPEQFHCRLQLLVEFIISCGLSLITG